MKGEDARLERAHTPIRLAICGGGTGGHIFPGVAILTALRELTPVECLWIGTGREVEMDILKGVEATYRELRVGPLYGVGAGRAVRAVWRLPVAVFQAKKILKEFGPDIVLGIGGYVAGPVMAAARWLKIPVVIHEQNLIPGLTNRWGARLANRIFVSFKGSIACLPRAKTMLVGNPVREEFLRLAHHEAVGARQAVPLHRPYHLLVIGGSQGARAINRLVSSALTILSGSGHDIRVVHQTGAKDRDYIRRIYDDADIPAEVHVFIEDMAGRYAWADLVIARAGAGTCAELAVSGTPSILIPYPHAASGHQEANAKELESAGASITLRESEVGPERLASTIAALMTNGERLARMGECARSIARPHAAREIAEEMLKITGKGADSV